MTVVFKKKFYNLCQSWPTKQKFRNFVNFCKLTYINEQQNSLFNRHANFKIKKVCSGTMMYHTGYSNTKDIPPLSEVCIMSNIPALEETLTRRMPLNMGSLYCPLQRRSKSELKNEELIRLGQVEIILGDGTVLSEIIPYLKKLKWAHCTWAGVEPILQSVKTFGITPKFILTRHSNNAICSLMGEYVVCQVLNWERQMTIAWENQKHCIWSLNGKLKEYRAISDVTISILGVGNMGRTVAKYLKGLGASLKGYSRNPKDLSQYGDFNIITQDLDDVLQNCHYVVNVLPHTALTEHLLTCDKFKSCNMKPVFINVGRGNIISESSLLKAIREDWISGAILDVFEHEPLSENSPLWSNPKIIITPHVAATSKIEHIVDGFLENYALYMTDSKLQNQVDWDAGY